MLIIIYLFDRVTDSYGITEVGGISWNGMVLAEGLFGFLIENFKLLN